MKISDLILNNINSDYLLPSIQREFVWLDNLKEKRVEKLFDSIMQEYPFGSILVWEVDKDLKSDKIDLEVYKFIQDYNKETPHNVIANLNGYQKIYLILDGQQRLTALNLGLRGTYSTISRNKTIEQKLYINLFSDIENDTENEYGFKYEFKFLNINNVINSEDELWYEVGKVLDFRNISTEEYKKKNKDFIKKHTTDEDKIDKSITVLGTLHNSICKTQPLTIQNISGDDEKALNVFVRTNDGGVKLEKADLLLSYMEANKEIFKPNGARKEINAFVDFVNKVDVHKPNYYLQKDDILKASLVLTDLEVQYKLKNFNKVNLEKISNNWENIKKYFEMTIKLIAKYGFSYKNIISNNSLIPIAYFLMQKGYRGEFVESDKTNDLKIKAEIIKWIVISQITGAFGSSSDSTLKKLREDIKNGKTFDNINNGKIIEKDDVEKWVDRESYGSKYSHLLLLLITSNSYWHDCHQDHIFPKSKFEVKTFEEMKLNSNKIEFYKKYRDSIINLQLLNPLTNIKKTNDDFINWSDAHSKRYLELSLIPTNKDYTFDMFEEFIMTRREMIIDKVFDVLKPTFNE